MGFKRVGFRTLKHGEKHGWFAIERDADILVLRAKLHRAHIFDANDPAFWRRFEDDVFKLFDIAEPAKRAKRGLKILFVRYRGRADIARSYLRVLFANGLHYVAGGHVAHAHF